jgi:hypothetical protein
MLAEITVRPSIEPTLNDMSEIIGRDILASIITFIHGGPQVG